MDRRSLLKGVAAIAPAIAAGGIATAADAELLDLGRQLNASWKAETDFLDANPMCSDEEFDAFFQTSSAIVARIEALRPTTPQGFAVKARAVSWCHSGEAVDLSTHTGQPATDIRLVNSIIEDLLRIT
ncbi:hypothetical protein [Ahrensia sp. R2A130]|uniref:hypothetical protein n=1 Tax=Ahrensia sp. R2A130 TaxID=744979 RepID=UPI0001E0B50B|nr:hypothetical protein [Ahrensia sp. R2A130]EFL88281.1 putative twin-arginine translocation pathway signal [Ahrensia sp. R2A130]